MKNATSSKTSSYSVIETHRVSDPARTALWFSTMLAADRGVGSSVVKAGRRTVDVVADDGRAVRFEFALQLIA